MTLDEDVDAFASAVGASGPVAVVGSGSHGVHVACDMVVRAPSGVAWIEPAEMTLCCGAGTPVAEVEAALAELGQCVAVPSGGTVGGALAVGRSSIRRLGWGPVRDTVLQIRYVSARGEVVKVGGPTVKNVSGFDLCRLLVGSYGTLGFIAEVIVRTRPLPPSERWFTSERDPWALLGELYRPASLLWNGTTTWVLLEGHVDDVARQAETSELRETDGPPPLPPYRRSVPPAALSELRHPTGVEFVAEIGVGIVRQDQPPPPAPRPSAAVIELHRRIKRELDPTGRLNPGLDALEPDG